MASPKTITALEQWMNDHCYNDSYAIGARQIYEGFGIKQTGETFIWYFTERGQHNDLKTFLTEEEAVAHAYKQICGDHYANRHLLCMVKDPQRVREIKNVLHERNIVFETDEIPYGGLRDMRTRIFVFGCDHFKAADLKTQHD